MAAIAHEDVPLSVMRNLDGILLRATAAMTMFVLLSVPSACIAGSLEPVRDPFLSKLMNGIEIAKEERTTDFVLRALRLQELGECDGSPDTCPKERFYLAISTIDDDPDQAVYELPMSHKWEIMNVSTIDSPGEDKRFVVLTMRREVLSKAPSDHWWDSEVYTVRLNPWTATIERQSR